MCDSSNGDGGWSWAVGGKLGDGCGNNTWPGQSARASSDSKGSWCNNCDGAVVSDRNSGRSRAVGGELRDGSGDIDGSLVLWRWVRDVWGVGWLDWVGDSAWAISDCQCLVGSSSVGLGAVSQGSCLWAVGGKSLNSDSGPKGLVGPGLSSGDEAHGGDEGCERLHVDCSDPNDCICVERT